MQYLKVSNDFINSIIVNNNHLTLKILFYSVLNGTIKDKDKYNIYIEADIVILKKLLNMDFKNIRQNIKKIQKTLITITNKDKDISDIQVIKKVTYKYGEQNILLEIDNLIYKELKELKNKYTFIDLNNIIKLTNKHSIRFLNILEQINTYDYKTKYLDKDTLNKIFGTNYKGVKEIERNIITHIQKELNEFSKLTFLYDLEYDIDKNTKGRPPLTGIKVVLKDNKIRQSRMFI
jgi:plasmid replication initiation protein